MVKLEERSGPTLRFFFFPLFCSNVCGLPFVRAAIVSEVIIWASVPLWEYLLGWVVRVGGWGQDTDSSVLSLCSAHGVWWVRSFRITSVGGGQSLRSFLRGCSSCPCSFSSKNLLSPPYYFHLAVTLYVCIPISGQVHLKSFKQTFIAWGTFEYRRRERDPIHALLPRHCDCSFTGDYFVFIVAYCVFI